MTDPDQNNDVTTKMPPPEWKASIGAMTPTEASQVTVTVLGGGIAGLTAAHELIHRGFNVRLIERSVGAIRPEALTSRDALHGHGKVDLGGVARSQWATDPKASAPEHGKAARSLSGLGDYTLVTRVDGKNTFVYGDASSGPFIAVKFDENNRLVSGEATRIAEWLKNVYPVPTQCNPQAITASGSTAPHRIVQLVALSYEDRRSLDPTTNSNTPPWGPEAARKRAVALKDTLSAVGLKDTLSARRWLPAAFVTVPIDEKTFDGTREFADGFPGVLLRIHESEDLLPGEHGFRFFPGFYWHLRDTMMRTPVYDFTKKNEDEDPDAVRTHRSVHDNLNEVEWQIMADPTRSFPTAFRRKPPSSTEEFIEQWQTLRNDLGFRESDMLRFMLRLGRFAASASQRRKEQYARMSWWDFVSLKDLDVTPQPSLRGGFRNKSKQDDTKSSASSPAASAAEDDGGDFTTEARQRWTTALDNSKKDRADGIIPGSWDALEKAFLKDVIPNDDEPLKLDPKRLPYGLRFRRALRHSPRALVAMDGLVTDAHTQGMLAIQLAMDQLGLNTMTDSTLNGPTSDAWFRHWHRYLEDEGVTFIPGEVTEIDITTGKYIYVRLDGETEKPEGEPKTAHYTICALDPVTVARLLVGQPPTDTRTAQKPASSVKKLITDAAAKTSPGEFLPLPALAKLFDETWVVVLDLKEPRIEKIKKNLGTKTPKDIWEGATLPDNTEGFCKKYHDWVYDWRASDAAGGSGTTIDPQNLGDSSKRKPNEQNARFQVLSGIQLFFKRPTAFEQGHIYFAESPWGLMGMSQLQHWRNWNARPSGIRGNLSLVYGSWRAENRGLGDFIISRLIVGAQKAHPFGKEVQPEEERTPWPSPGELTGDLLAEQTREQIAWCRGTDAQFRGDLHIPEITYYHMDDCIQYRGDEKVEDKDKVTGDDRVKARWNLCPYLINLRDDWDSRPPGEPWNPNRRDGRLAAPRKGQGYRVYGTDRPLVFAGAHTRTFTRMATMEAANESSRHAVNSVLWHLSMRREAAESILMAEKLEAEVTTPETKAVKTVASSPRSGLDISKLVWRDSPLSFNGYSRASILHSGGSPRPRVRQSDLPMLQTSWFGDFCEVRDHEDYEIPFLDFFKKIDAELYGAWETRGLQGRYATDNEREDEQEDPYPDDDNRVRRRARTRRPHLFDLLKLDTLPDRIDAGEFSIDETLRTLYSMGGVLLRAVRGPEPVKSVLNLIDSFDSLFVGKQKP